MKEGLSIHDPEKEKLILEGLIRDTEADIERSEEYSQGKNDRLEALRVELELVNEKIAEKTQVK